MFLLWGEREREDAYLFSFLCLCCIYYDLEQKLMSDFVEVGVYGRLHYISQMTYVTDDITPLAQATSSCAQKCLPQRRRGSHRRTEEWECVYVCASLNQRRVKATRLTAKGKPDLFFPFVHISRRWDVLV